MTQRTLAQWLEHAERLHPVGIDMGLARVREVAMRLAVLPPSPVNAVVAGTNGKGSTSVYLEALLKASGRNVGTTLSPHLDRFNERIRINGAPVADDIVCGAFEAIERARGEITLTYFEFGVLAALVAFKRANVDATVLEVGLGGRLDAVNIVDASVCLITSIGIDHVGYLGPDRESIGREKAGILRAAVPCVFGEADIPESIVDAAHTLGAPLLRAAVDFEAQSNATDWCFAGMCRSKRVVLDGLTLPSVALDNAATALQGFLLLAPDAPVADCVSASARSRLPGRFERFDRSGATVIVDVAHNPHGAAFLRAQLERQVCTRKTIAVAGFLQDKDAAGIVAALAGAVDEWIFVATRGARGQTATQSASRASVASGATVAEGDLVDVFNALFRRLTAGDRLVVLGSFDVAQRARAILNARAGTHD